MITEKAFSPYFHGKHCFSLLILFHHSYAAYSKRFLKKWSQTLPKKIVTNVYLLPCCIVPSSNINNGVKMSQKILSWNFNIIYHITESIWFVYYVWSFLNSLDGHFNLNVIERRANSRNTFPWLLLCVEI